MKKAQMIHKLTYKFSWKAAWFQTIRWISTFSTLGMLIEPLCSYAMFSFIKSFVQLQLYPLLTTNKINNFLFLYDVQKKNVLITIDSINRRIKTTRTKLCTQFWKHKIIPLWHNKTKINIKLSNMILSKYLDC